MPNGVQIFEREELAGARPYYVIVSGDSANEWLRMGLVEPSKMR